MARPSRRTFIFFLVNGFGLVIAKMFGAINLLLPRASAVSFLRPPGAGREDEFLAKCTRCRACANVCQAGCIKFFSFGENARSAGTPYLNARHKSCNLCMNCGQVCPTGALQPIERELGQIKEQVRMGKAYVLDTHCLSFNGRICGICHDACPLTGEAIVLMTRARPKVIEEACIGCGRCEEACPQMPSAILVEPTEKI